MISNISPQASFNGGLLKKGAKFYIETGDDTDKRIIAKLDDLIENNPHKLNLIYGSETGDIPNVKFSISDNEGKLYAVKNIPDDYSWINYDNINGDHFELSTNADDDYCEAKSEKTKTALKDLVDKCLGIFGDKTMEILFKK
jgi:hypothetical protein